MSHPSLEERLTVLEKQVAELLSNGVPSQPKKDWRQSIGMFTGDEVMKRIFEYALQYREKDRERARRRYAKDRRQGKK